MHEDAPFKNAHAALMFAYRFSSGQYALPLIHRMAGKSSGTGRGLSGLDGAAQAGMIRAAVAAIGRIHEAIVITRFAPETLPGLLGAERVNPEWKNAIATLSSLTRTTALAGCDANAPMRRDYVTRYVLRRVPTLEDIARRHGIHVNTARANALRVKNFFCQRAGGKHSIEQQALIAAEDAIAALIEK